MGVQSFVLFFSFFFPSYAVQGLEGLRYKLQTCNSIASIFGTNEDRVTVDSRTKFAVNLINIQEVMNIYSRKKRSNFCHGYKVNQV